MLGPSRLLQLQLAPFNSDTLLPGLAVFQRDKKFALMVSRGHRGERAGEQQREEHQIELGHARTSLRAITRSVALRERGFAATSSAPGRSALPINRYSACGS